MEIVPDIYVPFAKPYIQVFWNIIYDLQGTEISVSRKHLFDADDNPFPRPSLSRWYLADLNDVSKENRICLVNFLQNILQ